MMTLRIFLATAGLLLPGCAGVPLGVRADEVEGNELKGMIEDARLPEISGLAASVRTPGIWWALNDSGNPARLFALDAAGRTRAEFQVPGAKNVDWEDLTCAADPDGQAFLWIADTGDAGGGRAGGVLYRVPEPPLAGATARTEPAVAFPFTWPDGSRDCECLLVDGREGSGLLVTKLFLKPGVAEVYRFTLPTGPAAPLVLTRVPAGDVTSVSALRTLTGGSVSQDGRRVIVRTYTSGWLWERRPGTPLAAVFQNPATAVELPALLQGECIAFTPDGRAVLTASERLPSPLYRTPVSRGE